MENNYIAWPYDQTTPSRLGFRLIPQGRFYPAATGYIYVLAIEEHQWQNAVELMGNPEWANTELFQDFLARLGQLGRAESACWKDWFAGQVGPRGLPRGRKQTARALFAPVSTMGDLLKSEHLNARGFFAEIGHPESRLSALSGGTVQVRRPHRGPCAVRPHVSASTNEEVYGGQLGLTSEELQLFARKRRWFESRDEGEA